MKLLADYWRELSRGAVGGWQRFWFTPADPATLGLIRILAGLMLLYTHLVWSFDLQAFFGTHAWLSPDAVGAFYAAIDGPDARSFAWSYLWLIESPWLLWTVHLAGLAVFALLTVGLFSRVASVLAWLVAVAYVNRVPGALFGLDQINVMLAMYLMVGPSGSAFSLDAWRQRRRGGNTAPQPSVSANVAIRLIQLHMCIIYLFAGLSKLSGGVGSWWDGTAMWLALANLEYQSLDMTWLAGWPLAVNFLTHLIVFWEISYSALIWPRLTRPLMLTLAVPLHLGIAVCLGMMTFGLVMLIANLAFVSPALVRLAAARAVGRSSREAQPIPAAQSGPPRGVRRKAAAATPKR